MSKHAAEVTLDCNFARSYVMKYSMSLAQADRVLDAACEAARRRIERTFHREVARHLNFGHKTAEPSEEAIRP